MSNYFQSLHTLINAPKTPIRLQTNIPPSSSFQPMDIIQNPNQSSASSTLSDTLVSTGDFLHSTEYLAAPNPEIKIYLIKMLGFSLAAAVASIILIFITEEILDWGHLLMAAVPYLIFAVNLEILARMKFFGDIWYENEEDFKIFDHLAMISAAKIILLRLSGTFLPSLMIPTPFLLIFLSYIWRSKVKRSEKYTWILIRASYLVQSFILALQLDNSISLSWNFAYIFAIIYLSANIIFLNFNSSAYWDRWQSFSAAQTDLSHQYRVTIMKRIGSLWLFLYNSLFRLALFVMISSCIENSRGVTRLLAGISFTVGIALLVLTALGWKYLVKFFAVIRLVQCHRAVKSEAHQRADEFIYRDDYDTKTFNLLPQKKFQE